MYCLQEVMSTFEQGQRLQLDVLRVAVPGAALRLLGLLLERPLRERVNAVDERARHPGWRVLRFSSVRTVLSHALVTHQDTTLTLGPHEAARTHLYTFTSALLALCFLVLASSRPS